MEPIYHYLKERNREKRNDKNFEEFMRKVNSHLSTIAEVHWQDLPDYDYARCFKNHENPGKVAQHVLRIAGFHLF